MLSSFETSITHTNSNYANEFDACAGGLMEWAMYYHKNGFKEAWDYLLTAMNYTRQEIRSYDKIRTIYCNIFIIRPHILKQLTALMNTAIHIAETNSIVQSYLQQDSVYNWGTEGVALKVFGTKYYQLYPFIFERLPSFFLHSIKAKICFTDSQGPCKYNGA
jgi:hypothetical protein